MFSAHGGVLGMTIRHPAGTMGATLAPVLVEGGMGEPESPMPPAVLMLTKPLGVVDGT